MYDSHQNLLDSLTALDPAEHVRQAQTLLTSGQVRSFVPFLPFFYRWDGRPLTLAHHPQFESAYGLDFPKQTLYRTARQVGKSLTEAVSGTMRASLIPDFKVLYITPLFDQVRRLSSNYVRPLIENSPFKNLWTDATTDRSVLQRTFLSRGMLQFSFALLDCDRVRGFRTDELDLDEIQNMDRTHLPIIKETMSHSRWGLTRMSGTPLTPENFIDLLWHQSSQAEWIIPCLACRRWNIPSLAYDLERMIGPWRADICTERPGLICAGVKCGRPIDPRLGHWEHRQASKRSSFPGYHIPQPIMHIHYASPEKWTELLAKRDGQGGYTEDRYKNEVLGESCGRGVNLVGLDELKAACRLPYTNDPKQMPPADLLERYYRYPHRVLAVDWGGGGEEMISLTTLALLGMAAGGKIDVLWGRRLLTPHDHHAEAEECLHWFRHFRCQYFVHDFNGAGDLRETVMVHGRSGLDDRMVRVSYGRPARRQIVLYHPPSDVNPRGFYHVDKSYTLLVTCNAIRRGFLSFFRFDERSELEPGLVRDFLALYEDKRPTHFGGDLYTVRSNAMLRDDFAQAVNMGASMLWHSQDCWPNFTRSLRPNSPELVDRLHHTDWGKT